MTQDGKKQEHGLESGIGKLRQVAEQTGQAIDSQIQKVTFLKMTSRCVSFSSGPEKQQNQVGEPRTSHTD